MRYSQFLTLIMTVISASADDVLKVKPGLWVFTNDGVHIQYAMLMSNSRHSMSFEMKMNIQGERVREC